MSPQCSTDLTMAEVRPPKFLTGIERFQACARHTPNPGSVAGGTRCQPDRRTAYGLSIGGTSEIYTSVSPATFRKYPYGATSSAKKINKKIHFVQLVSRMIWKNLIFAKFRFVRFKCVSGLSVWIVAP